MKSTNEKWKNIWQAMLDIVYPIYCPLCKDAMEESEKFLCWSCLAEMEETEMYRFEKNPITELFDGIVPIHKATAFYYFQKEGSLQKLIHQLKYKGDKEVGYWLGKRMGKGLEHWLDGIDIVLPVPIHERKKILRGYNQSAVLAEGLSLESGIPWDDKILIKAKNNSSQTNKNKLQRIENVKEVFELKEPDKIKDKDILLLDDVITTGSTMISCIEEIYKKGQPSSISILVLAAQPFL